MTKEEALKRVKGYLTDYFPLEDSDEIDEIMDALEQESTTKDCISRAEAIKGLGEQPYVWTDSDFEIQQLADWKTHKEMLENLPSVTSTCKKGKWLGDKRYPICPKCNCNIIEEYISCSDYAEMYKPMKFCPNCGAEMEEVEE